MTTPASSPQRGARGRARFAGALAVLLCLAIGGFAALNWAPDVPVDSLKAKWAPPPSEFMGLDGYQVHLRDEGPRDDSVPIVLLHGTSSSLHTWDGWADSLKATRRVIRFDLPGFGLTGPAPDGDYSMQAYSLFVQRTLEAIGVHRVVLAGNSLGGWIAWRVALAKPELVQRLILVDAAGYPFHSHSVPIGFRLARIPVLKGLLQRVMPRSVVEGSVRNVFGDPAKVTPALVDRYFDLARRQGNRAAMVARFSQDRADPDTAAVRMIPQPTLILWGGRDRLIPPDNAGRFARDIAGSRVVMFPQLGHVPHEEDPAATMVAVRRFLAETK
ncbi:MAG: alpha/beta hydrolase [Gemmatimonadetes bacterium]|nr:alpha/beta hydrolase [Gemmatimonadota bacterium]